MPGEGLTPEAAALRACARAWVKETPDSLRSETVARVAAEIRAAEARGLERAALAAEPFDRLIAMHIRALAPAAPKAAPPADALREADRMMRLAMKIAYRKREEWGALGDSDDAKAVSGCGDVLVGLRAAFIEERKRLGLTPALLPLPVDDDALARSAPPAPPKA